MKLERIETLGHFERRGEDWNEFLFSSDLNTVFLTHEWLSAWWQCLSGDSEMHVLIFRDQYDRILGMAPLRIMEERMFFMASHEVTDYCDFITHPEHREDFFRRLLHHFREHSSDFTRFEFINIEQNSPTLLFLPRLAAQYGLNCSQVESEVVPVLDLPSSYDAFVSGLTRKNRHELRRKLRKMAALKDFRAEKITKPDELMAVVDSFIDLHRESNSAKTNFWRKEGMADFFRETVYQFGRRGWVELNCLFAKESLIAALLNFTYQQEILFYNVAFHADFASYSPGFYLFNASINEAISARKTRADFLRGREKYKYDFGAKECKIYSLILTPGESHS